MNAPFFTQAAPASTQSPSSPSREPVTKRVMQFWLTPVDCRDKSWITTTSDTDITYLSSTNKGFMKTFALLLCYIALCWFYIVRKGCWWVCVHVLTILNCLFWRKNHWSISILSKFYVQLKSYLVCKFFERLGNYLFQQRYTNNMYCNRTINQPHYSQVLR